MILAEGRRSGPGDASLVREGVSSDEVFSVNIPALSRTSSLLRPAGRSLKAPSPGLFCGGGMVRSGASRNACQRGALA
ncbi:hypothetical protein B1F69_09755 [Pseudomonas syringae]|nr:hypothetical protein B1F69_09755 [Pseudomonas syringae]